MSDISPIGRPAAPSLDKTHATSHPRALTGSPVRGQDSVELSDVARLAAKIRDVPVRHELVEDIKSRLANDTYESSDKIDAALDNLIEDIV